MTAPVHLAFFFCISQKLSLCWWWRLTATNKITQTDLTIDPLLNLMLLKPKTFVFLALTIQMGHGVRDKLTDHWSTLDQLYTSFVTYILLTTGMNLKGQTKILTDYGRYETCLKLWIVHFPNFTTLPKIWVLTKLLFPSREGWFSNSTYQRNASISASKFSNFVT